MLSIEEIKESGLLESYVIGEITEDSLPLVEQAIIDYPELRNEIQEIELSFATYAQAHEVAPNPTSKPMLMAVLAYKLRLESGEALSNPPLINSNSKISDYSEWLDNPILQEPDAYDKMHGHIIGASKENKMLIVWLTDGAPPEIHTDELETFLIVEGSCDITIGDNMHSLVPGDILSIPLHLSHHVRVTSDIACKIILQRKAA